MKELANIDKNETFLKRVFKYFNSLLIIDKSIDLILIFVGLLAALGVESYQQYVQKEERYIDMVARMYNEVQINDYILDNYESSLKGFLSISKEILELVNSERYQYYDGINEMIKLENDPLEVKVYQAINSGDFLNRILYSEIIHLYDLYAKLGEEMDVSRKELIQYNYNFYRLFVKYNYNFDDQLNEFIEINYLFNSITKSLPGIQSLLMDIEATNKRLLDNLEFELEKYETNSEERKNLSDYHNLAIYAGASRRHRESVEFSQAGIDRIGDLINDSLNQDFLEHSNYFGRFNYTAYISKVAVYKEGDTITYPKDDIFQNLVDWDSTNYESELSSIGFLEYYYFIEKDLEKFMRYLKDSIERYPDCQSLSENLNNYTDFTSEKELIELLDQSVPMNLNWREWISGVKLYD